MLCGECVGEWWSGSGKNKVQRNWMTWPRTQTYQQQSPPSLISTQSCFPRRCRFWEFWSPGYQLGGGKKVGKGWFLKAESNPFLAVQILSRGDNGAQSWMKGLPAPSQHSQPLPLTHQSRTCKTEILGDGALTMVLKYWLYRVCCRKKILIQRELKKKKEKRKITYNSTVYIQTHKLLVSYLPDSILCR